MRSSAEPGLRRRLRRLARLALLTGSALVLHVFETLVPAPLPWLRVGLANVVAVTLLETDGPGAALVVTLLRVVLGALLLGALLSPAFLLSLAGGLAAVGAMVAARALARGVLSLVGISVVGAVAHNAGQAALLATLFVPPAAALRLLPWLVLSATLVGGLTGLSARALAQYLTAARGGRHGADVRD